MFHVRPGTLAFCAAGRQLPATGRPVLRSSSSSPPLPPPLGRDPQLLVAVHPRGCSHSGRNGKSSRSSGSGPRQERAAAAGPDRADERACRPRSPLWPVSTPPRMPRPNDRTCSYAGRLVRPAAPRLTTPSHFLLLVVVVVGLLGIGSAPTVAAARMYGSAGSTMPKPHGATSSSSSMSSSSAASSSAVASTAAVDTQARSKEVERDQANQTSAENRHQRSLSVYSQVNHNEKRLVSKGGDYILIYANGTVATTKDLNPPHAILVFSSTISHLKNDTFFSTRLPEKKPLVMIMGKLAGKYLCMNRKGRVYAAVITERDNNKRDCQFEETIQEHKYTTICQQKRRPKAGCTKNCLGLTSNGKIRRGRKVCDNDEQAKFTPVKVNPDETNTRIPALGTTTGVPRVSVTPSRTGGGGGGGSGSGHGRRRRPNKRRKNRRKGSGGGGGGGNACRNLFCSSRVTPRSHNRRPDGATLGSESPRRQRRKHRRRDRHRRRRTHRRSQRARRDQDRQEVGPLSDIR